MPDMITAKNGFVVLMSRRSTSGVGISSESSCDFEGRLPDARGLPRDEVTPADIMVLRLRSRAATR